jgi:adenine deaminase
MRKEPFTIKGNFVDLKNKAIYPAEVTVENGRIHQISRIPEQERQIDHKYDIVLF